MAPIAFGRSLAVAVAAAIVLILPSPALAQQVGVKGGINSASLTLGDEEGPDISRVIGAIAGVWVRTPSTGRFSFQVEGLYAGKGATIEAGELRVDLRLHYV